MGGVRKRAATKTKVLVEWPSLSDLVPYTKQVSFQCYIIAHRHEYPSFGERVERSRVGVEEAVGTRQLSLLSHDESKSKRTFLLIYDL